MWPLWTLATTFDLDDLTCILATSDQFKEAPSCPEERWSSRLAMLCDSSWSNGPRRAVDSWSRTNSLKQRQPLMHYGCYHLLASQSVLSMTCWKAIAQKEISDSRMDILWTKLALSGIKKVPTCLENEMIQYIIKYNITSENI